MTNTPNFGGLLDVESTVSCSAFGDTSAVDSREISTFPVNHMWKMKIDLLWRIDRKYGSSGAAIAQVAIHEHHVGMGEHLKLLFWYDSLSHIVISRLIIAVNLWTMLQAVQWLPRRRTMKIVMISHLIEILANDVDLRLRDSKLM